MEHDDVGGLLDSAGVLFKVSSRINDDSVNHGPMWMVLVGLMEDGIYNGS